MGEPTRKRKNIKRKKAKEVELLPDAWELFERGLKAIAKAPPQHRGKTKR